MKQSMLNTKSLPYCKGCGHDFIAKHTVKALEKLGFDPLDVIMVTDIGCHGIIDKCMNTHTVHGLHGRSPALGAGIFFGLGQPQEKKVIVFIGDGGATIGLQHIMEAARLNLDITVVVHNNMLYGMTGGQTSGLTPCAYRTTTSSEGNPFEGYDICRLAHTAGARHVSRIVGLGDFSDDMMKALDQPGFSLVEVMENCPSYGIKYNPDWKLKDIIKDTGREPGEWTNDDPVFTHKQGKKTDNLFNHTEQIRKSFENRLTQPASLVLSGSAGEGVQLAARLLSKGAISAGLHVTQKGSYPVTVGVGFSTAEVNLSPEPINFHGISIPDYVIITSNDGLEHSRNRIERMESGVLFIDNNLEIPETKAQVITNNFRETGARNAAIYAVLYFAKESGFFSEDAIFEAIKREGKQDKIPVERFKQYLKNTRRLPTEICN